LIDSLLVFRQTLCFEFIKDATKKTGDPGGKRTSDPRFRKPMLYPTELRAPLKPLFTSERFIASEIYPNTLFIRLRTTHVLLSNKLPK